MALHISLQLVFGVARAANERVAGMVERSGDAPQEISVHGVLGTVFVICLVMPAISDGL